MPTQSLITTVTAAKVNSKYVVFTQDADLSQYPAEVLSKFVFTHDEAATGTLIRVSDLIESYGLHQNAQGGYNATAYRLAYASSFARVVCKSVESPTGTASREEGSALLAQSAVDGLPADVLAAFVQIADPTAISEADVDALKKMRQPSGEVDFRKAEAHPPPKQDDPA